jgi:hypothetical protein
MENIWKYIWKIYGKYMGNMGNMGTCCLKFDGIWGNKIWDDKVIWPIAMEVWGETPNS